MALEAFDERISILRVQAVDRPLSEQELGKLRALSTRAEITSTSFTNT